MPPGAVGAGPLVVQSDRTLLLEVDHPDAAACRIAIAPFAELERAPEHIHTYRLTPLGLWNARAAGHDAEQVVDTLLTYSRYPVRQRPAGRRRRHHGPLRPAADREAPDARPGAGQHRPPGARRGAEERQGQGPRGREGRRRHRRRAPLRARPPQAGAAEARLAGGGPRGLRRRRGARHRPRPGRLGAAPLPGPGRRRLLARRLGRRRPPLRGGQDDRRRGRHGQGAGDDAHPRHQHRLGPPVARRAGQADHPEPGGDRRVLRRQEGDPAGHHRHLPGDHHQARRRAPAPGAVRRPRLGPDHLRRGAPAARARVPDDGRPAGPPPARA